MLKNEISIHKFNPQWGLKHSVGHSQGIGMKFCFFFDFFCQNMLKNEISIHKFNPQWGLKHSVGHSQGIGMKFCFFFDFFLSKYVEKWNFYP